VPHQHPDSNTDATIQVLISHVPIPEFQVHPIPTTGMTPQESAAQYERVVLDLFGGGAPHLLNASRWVLFLVTGASKFPALQRVFDPWLGGDPFPPVLISPSRRRLTWLVDLEAASLLPSTGD
jgi:6-phosphogluconolactonase/glucosamine-6-phosphate isomerase/deaminase